jgi:hypothetical protein
VREQVGQEAQGDAPEKVRAIPARSKPDEAVEIRESLIRTTPIALDHRAQLIGRRLTRACLDENVEALQGGVVVFPIQSLAGYFQRIGRTPCRKNESRGQQAGGQSQGQK